MVHGNTELNAHPVAAGSGQVSNQTSTAHTGLMMSLGEEERVKSRSLLATMPVAFMRAQKRKLNDAQVESRDAISALEVCSGKVDEAVGGVHCARSSRPLMEEPLLPTSKLAVVTAQTPPRSHPRSSLLETSPQRPLFGIASLMSPGSGPSSPASSAPIQQTAL